MLQWFEVLTQTSLKTKSGAAMAAPAAPMARALLYAYPLDMKDSYTVNNT